jgi:hypothetical protein
LVPGAIKTDRDKHYAEQAPCRSKLPWRVHDEHAAADKPAAALLACDA